MSIFINGMDMPTSCGMCWSLDDYGDYPRCRITEEQRGYNFPIREKRMDKCPISPVPPHGDLIERDALMKLEAVPSDNWVFRAIEKAPTIIPAEEGE